MRKTKEKVFFFGFSMTEYLQHR